MIYILEIFKNTKWMCDFSQVQNDVKLTRSVRNRTQNKSGTLTYFLSHKGCPLHNYKKSYHLPCLQLDEFYVYSKTSWKQKCASLRPALYSHRPIAVYTTHYFITSFAVMLIKSTNSNDYSLNTEFSQSSSKGSFRFQILHIPCVCFQCCFDHLWIVHPKDLVISL